MPEALSNVRSVGPYDGWLRGAITQFKYHGEWGRAESLSLALALVIADLTPCDALVPVPLHRTRFRQRGFNQSLLLAEHAARFLGTDVSEPLVRTRQTPAQVNLAAEERRANVAGAFTVHLDHDVGGRSLIVIDDVITTGSTLAACTDALIQAGAQSVAIATLAREL